MTETCDPTTFIFDQGEGWKIYVEVDGDSIVRKWKVTGTCDRRGDCWVGGIMNTPDGPVLVESIEHYQELRAQIGDAWIDAQPDVPIAPGFDGCCPFVIEVLD